MEPITLRPANENDLPAINDIYNYYVMHCTCTYQEEPETLADRTLWFAAHEPKHPVIVAELEGQIVGWGSLSRFHARSAYRATVENAVYVKNGYHRRGIGRMLLRELIKRAGEIGHHTVVALISADQPASIELHKSEGFVEVGRLREVGQKFGRWLDVVYLQKLFYRDEQDSTG